MTDLDFPSATPPPRAELFDAGLLGADGALVWVLAVAFIALALILLLLFLPRGNPEATRTLRRGLTLTERRASNAPTAPTPGLSASAIGQRAMAAVSAAPKPKGYEEQVQVELDQAGWQMRASEFIVIRILSAIAGFALLWALSGSLLFGVVGAVSGLYLPTVAKANSRSRRVRRFAEQLPDALQLLAGTLKAGYGILQGIDTLVQETTPPMSQEFQRVLTEARLGLPLDDSLNAMSERVGSEDFRWVVVAMNIQRTVGGNLAELLETVSETLRERDQVRRQVKVLSAEGKLSAIILVALPFVLLLYLFVVNPTYLTPLITSVIGWFMIGGALILMVVGVLWMSRLIKIDV